MAKNINHVVLTGNLTRDPEVRTLASGTSVAHLRIAVNTSRKNSQTQQWEDKPNYFDIVVWGAQATNCGQYLSQGSPIAVEGRLEWSEWDAKDGSGKRSKVEVTAETIQFLHRAPAGGYQQQQQAAPPWAGQPQPGYPQAPPPPGYPQQMPPPQQAIPPAQPPAPQGQPGQQQVWTPPPQQAAPPPPPPAQQQAPPPPPPQQQAPPPPQQGDPAMRPDTTGLPMDQGRPGAAGSEDDIPF